MSESIDELARRWKAHPDAAASIALCDALSRSSPVAWPGLVDELGKAASGEHSANGPVLVAVAKLFTAVDRLSDAQGLLVSAGRVAPKDAGVFRSLGEVLLRRGDAERAEKVLQRAQQLGANDPETAMWLERAKVFKPVQAKAGARAVANEIKSTSVHPVTPHPDLLPKARKPLPSVDQEGVTTVRKAPEIRVPAAPPPIPAAGRPPTPPSSVRAVGLSLSSDTTVSKGSPYGPDDEKTDFMRQPTAPKVAAAQASQASDEGVTISISMNAPAPAPASAARAAVPSFSSEERTEITRGPDFSSPLRPKGPSGVGASEGQATAVMPSAQDVLKALANAGVFEAKEATTAPVLWDRPNEKARRRTAIILGAGLIAFVVGSGGVYHEIQRRRGLAHQEAEASLTKVESDLNASKASLLPDVEQTIGHAFELDSRSPRAAADWLEERAIKGLLQGGGEIAFEDAVARALEVKVPEDQVAYARVAAFLFQGDTGGAAGLMPKYDAAGQTLPLYQLITGATLEHAGDPHAVERYQAAQKLAPNLVLTDILLARATAIDGDPTKAADLAKQFKAKYPDRPEGSALVALAWGRDPARGEQAPPEVNDMLLHSADLPLPLMAIPHALKAALAIDKHAYADANAEITKGLAVADCPGMATWLGSLALETRDEALVRKAALLAVTFSAVYAPARVLAGRIALLGGRLDEALKATEDLDPTSPDVAIVRAAVAYERADADGVSRALESVPADAKKLPVFGALSIAGDVLLGRTSLAAPKLAELSTDDAPWSDLIAMDAALDLGLTEVADKIQTDWKGTEEKPLKAVRLSRLARYENRLDDADRYSKIAIDGSTVTPRVLVERAMVLVARNKAAEVGPLLARYPLVLGPASSWLSAYALASTGKLEDAKGRTAQLDFPPDLSPLPLRVMAAVSLGAMKDKKRGEPAVESLLDSGCADPDLLAAAAALGMKPGTAPKAAPKAAGGRRRR